MPYANYYEEPGFLTQYEGYGNNQDFQDLAGAATTIYTVYKPINTFFRQIFNFILQEISESFLQLCERNLKKKSFFP